MSKRANFIKAFAVMCKEEATPKAKFNQLVEGFRPLAAKPVEKNVDELVLSTITAALAQCKETGYYAGRDSEFWKEVKGFYQDYKKHGNK